MRVFGWCRRGGWAQWFTVIAALIGVGLTTTVQAVGAPGDEGKPASIEIKVLSNRPDLVSGDDALVEIVLPKGAKPEQLKADVDGRDVSDLFAIRDNGRIMGLLDRLALGDNELTVSVPGAPGEGAGREASLTITNHPAGGPVIYEPQVRPWGCAEGAVDTQCNRPVSYAYKYKSTTQNGFQDYDPAHPPNDVATTTTDQGRTVPFIVRIETGVLDRDYYHIAVLFEPGQRWDRWAPQPAWNHKLFITHGAGFGLGHEQLARGPFNVLNKNALSKGFAVMFTELNDLGHNGNIAVQAEATMMVKEHLIESYGDLRYTFGLGGSGGAIAQQWMANAYPGLYDGIIPAAAYPDAGSTILEVEDCALLRNYFDNSGEWSPGVSWTAEQQAAASGHQTTALCAEWSTVYHYNDAFNPSATVQPPGGGTGPGPAPTYNGGCDVAQEQVYHPVTNPTGVRCDAQDYMVGIFGKRKGDGFANRPYDNVGIQYGLAALKAGKITPAQFVDLNTKIGSHDIDYNFQSTRVAADAPALPASYRSGWINEGNGMGDVAIIHLRRADTFGQHHQYRSWTMQARLDREIGHHQNMAIWFEAGSSTEAFSVMDDWLSAVEADTTGRTRADKVVANRPPEANDRCGARDGTGLSMMECTGIEDGSPRMAAGLDIVDDVIACQLKPLDRTGYPVEFTDDQWARLVATFPSGVCDYTKPGKGQQPTESWPAYLKSGRVVN